MAKILFIEDEPEHIAIYKTKLEQEGFLFVSAKTSQEGISLVQKEKPDLILLDILLPGEENGIDALAKLKDNPETKNIPVVVFTNYDTKEFREQTTHLGANDFVLKSDITPGQMTEKIKQFLKNKNV